MTHAVGVDIGGTFTDFVALGDDGRVVVSKRLTTPDEPSRAVLEGLVSLQQEQAVVLSEVNRIIHGTTLVANSLIERRGARAALVTTAGFRDVLEIGREGRYDIYDLALERPEPLVPRPLRHEVSERILADGTVHEPLDERQARQLARDLLEGDVESVAVCLINAYANPDHEERLREIFAKNAPELDVTISSAIVREWREYERSSTAAANAFVRPLVRKYLTTLENGLRDLDVAGRLYVMLSQGGVTSAEVAAQLPIHLVEGGPAGGVMAAAFVGRGASESEVIAFDMGGTTTKISVIHKGEPLTTSEFEVARVARFKRGSGLPLKIPSVELVEIGAGGGSIAHVDALGLLKVGPQSAGADPGPCCYARGGTLPTVTDADLQLGYLNPDYFLGGKMPLEAQRAEAALAELGEKLNLDADGCARGVFRVVSQQMSLALRTHVVERGFDPRSFTLVAGGGAGPVHAYEIARLLSLPKILCQPAAGVASALGFLVAPFSIDLSQTYVTPLSEVEWPLLLQRFEDMAREARQLLASAGVDPADIEFRQRLDMRYLGQGYEIPVDMPDVGEPDHLIATLSETFRREYRTLFGSSLSTSDLEVLHLRLTAASSQDTPDVRVTFAEAGDARRAQRDAYFPELDSSIPCDVYDRYSLSGGTTYRGPALIEERESTIVIGPSASFLVDPAGNVCIEAAW